MGLSAGGFVFFVFAYSGLAGLWGYIVVVCFARAKLLTEYPTVARLYAVIAACAAAACALVILDIARQLAPGAWGWSGPTLITTLISLALHVFAITITIFAGVRGLLPRLSSAEAARQHEIGELQRALDQRAVDLRTAQDQLARFNIERTEINERLANERAMLEAIMNAGAGAICTVDLGGTIVFANESCQNVLGVTEREAVGRRYNAPEWKQTNTSGAALEDAEMPFRRVMHAGKPVHGMQYAVEWPDGSRHMLGASGAPWRNADNTPAGVVLLLSDISRQKEDEERLRNNERRFRIMVEGLPSGAVHVEGENLFMNRATEQITGYTRDEITTVNQWFWALFGEESTTARVEYEQNLDAGSSTSTTNTIRRKDGELRILQFDTHRSQNSVVWLMHDVTERFRVEGALRASEEKYRLLAETARDMICVHDINGRLTYHNAAMRQFAEMMTGQVEDLYACNFLTAESRERVSGRWERRLAGDRSRWLYELEAVKQDGSIVPLEVSAAPIETNGVITGSLSIMRDVSERKTSDESRRRLEAQMFHTQKLESLGVLASGIAHDFNNILMGILGNTDLLRPMIDTPESRDCFDDISQGAKRASELCRMLLVFAGEGEFTPEPVDINTVVSDSIRFMRSGIARGIQIELDLAKHLPRLEGDSTDLHQMLLVILANAADAIGDTGGGITVKTGAVPAGAAPETSVGDALPPGDYISISVTDTGCGMSEEVASKMFDPFYTTKTRSRGLGLARALGVARAHGGAMNVSTRAGHGTTITVYVAAHAAQSRKAPTILDQESLWHGEGTILVVDDEENVRSITKRMLQRLGFDVLLAADGQEAVEMVSKAAK
ncbi:MAG: PAS domain S-box protein, partial [Candidatus Hydrogenedentes bacterium]|nr:PAS domain S-box protein [Candidatus Hydrogenedentota bacterium]